MKRFLLLAVVTLAAARDGYCLTVERPPLMDDATAADCRRTLHKRGLITSTHAVATGETGWVLTAQGWNSVEPIRVPAGESEEAA